MAEGKTEEEVDPEATQEMKAEEGHVEESPSAEHDVPDGIDSPHVTGEEWGAGPEPGAPAVRKVTYTIPREDKNVYATFAWEHGLDTREVIISARDYSGRAIPVHSEITGPNHVKVTPHPKTMPNPHTGEETEYSVYLTSGDTLIAIG